LSFEDVIASAVDTSAAPAEVIETPEPTADATEAPAEVATPDATSPTETPTEAAPTPTAVSDDTLVEVLVDGKPQQMSWGEARKGVMMHAAFTKKTQAAAAERTQAAEERAAAAAERQQLAAERAQMQQVFADPAKLSAVYLALQARQNGQTPPPQAAAAPTFDPAAFQQHLLNTIVPQAVQQIQYKQQKAALETDVTSYTNGLISSDPVLAVIPGFEDRLYGDVAAMEPSTPAEAKEFILNYIEDAKAKIQTALGNTAKVAAVAKAKAASATERGGSAVLPAAKTYTSLDDPQREADMMATIAKIVGS
jgi:hypothetical protein